MEGGIIPRAIPHQSPDGLVHAPLVGVHPNPPILCSVKQKTAPLYGHNVNRVAYVARSWAFGVQTDFRPLLYGSLSWWQKQASPSAKYRAFSAEAYRCVEHLRMCRLFVHLVRHNVVDEILVVRARLALGNNGKW